MPALSPGKGQKMNTEKKLVMEDVRINRAIKEIADLTTNLNELLLEKNFDDSADVVMKIEETLNWIKFQEKQRLASSSNVTGKSFRAVGEW
jgi:predicted metal-dependent peptidase